jgi:hypothetical protein
LLLETKTNFSGAHLSQARTVLACSTDLALAVLAGTKALDAAYGEAKNKRDAPTRPRALTLRPPSSDGTTNSRSAGTCRGHPQSGRRCSPARHGSMCSAPAKSRKPSCF